eukprot:gene6969-11135_t
MQYTENTYKLTDGLQIATKEIGNPESPNKVLTLHGWLDNANSFDFLVSHFDLAKYHVVQMDFSGHGKSSHKQSYSHYNVGSRVSEVFQMIELLKWNKFILIGHSMGGAVATMYASIYSKYISHLILVDSLGPFLKPEISARKLLMLNISSNQNLIKKQPKNFKSFEKLVENSYAARKNDISKDSLTYLMKRGFLKTSNGFQYSHHILCQGISQFQYHEEDVVDMLKHIKCPTMFILCSNSMDLFKNDTTGVGKSYHKRTEYIADIKVEIIDNSAHHLHMDKSKEVFELVNNFIKPKSKM